MTRTITTLVLASAVSASLLASGGVIAESHQEDAPPLPTKQWALITNGHSEQTTMPELMTKEVCREIGRVINTKWKSSIMCANLTTGEVLHLF